MGIKINPIQILGILCFLTASSQAFAACLCVPELDPGSMMGGLTLLAGSLMLVLGRGKKR
jgi:hypothetical protein